MADFTHRDHVALAWTHLRQSPPAAAAPGVAGFIRALAAQHGAPHKYHETMTRAWVRLVAGAMRLTPHVDEFETFATLHPYLFDRDLLARFYSPERLASEAARAAWLEPDRAPLP